MLSPYRRNAKMLRPASPSKQRAEPLVPSLFPLPGDPYTELADDPIQKKRIKERNRQREKRANRRLRGGKPLPLKAPVCYLCGYKKEICRCPKFYTRSEYLKERRKN